jgi:hypothetical protein
MLKRICSVLLEYAIVAIILLNSIVLIACPRVPLLLGHGMSNRGVCVGFRTKVSCNHYCADYERKKKKNY